MSSCRYCEEFVQATRRLEPKLNEDGEKQKRVPNRRLCSATKAWVEEDGEMCPSYVTANSFWCDRLQQCQVIDSCRNRVAKKLSKWCKKKCPQYKDVLEALKMRARTHKVIESKPILLRRKGVQNGLI